MPEVNASKYTVHAGWDDVPHLDGKTKEELLRSIPPHLRKPRSTGTPGLGAGAIYPIEVDEILCDPFKIPDYWPRGYGMDVGWKRTAATWGARDPETNTIYLYAEHYMGKALPLVHATAIKARGEWINGTIDPAARGRSQVDGKRLMTNYQTLGLRLTKATNAVEAGIYDVWSLLMTGGLRVFSTMRHWQNEYRLYRRDEDGNIVKQNDHLMDCTRYLIADNRQIMNLRPKVKDVADQGYRVANNKAGY